jgi:hypothetical protein
MKAKHRGKSIIKDAKLKMACLGELKGFALRCFEKIELRFSKNRNCF